MYFAYGWPKLAFTELQPGDSYVYLHATEKFLFAVSRTSVQLWSGGLHRLKLSECVRSEEDVKQEGWHVTALWSPAKATLAILTSENYLHLYAIHTWKDTLLHPSCNIPAKDIQKVDIYLRSSIRMDSDSRALSITGDSRLIIVGFADGTVASLSWSGKMREVAYPLDDATDFGDDSYLDAEQQVDQLGRRLGALETHFSGPTSTPSPEPAGWQQQPQQLLPPPFQRPDVAGAGAAQPTTALPTGGSGAGVSVFAPAAAVASVAVGMGGHYVSFGRAIGALLPPSQLSRAIVQMRYCELSGQVVMVLADGAAAVCAAPEGGLSPLGELCFGRWLCGPAQQAVCAQVGARAQLIAVGRESGEVALYRLHRTALGSPGPTETGGYSPYGSGGGAQLPEAYDGAALEPPVRVLSLESWGHKVQQTGPVAQIEWSPDGRALAVGYAGQGVVVWSPSGCRLMCSLRQPAPSCSLSPLPSALPRGALSHQASMASRSPTPAQDHARTTLSPMQSMGGGGGAGQRSYNGVGAASAPPQVPLDGGVSALCWGPGGYQLEVGELGAGGGAGALLELQFAHSLPGQHRVARGGLGSSLADEEVHVLQGHDRLLLIREPGEAALGGVPWATGDGTEPAVGQVGDLTVSHVPVPYSYVSSNWPLQHCAVSVSGSDIAVAGRNGLAVYNRVTERWRLFGDISQERQVSCRAMGWLSSGVLVACSGPDPHAPLVAPPSGPLVMGGTGAAGAGGVCGSELLLLPRYHLDLTSLLARHPLPQPPMAMDCLGSHILLASEPLEITLLEVAVQGELSPTGNPRAIISTLRQISMVDVGRFLSDVALVPLLPVAAGAPGGAGGAAAASSSSSASASAAAAAAAAASAAAALVAAPRQCVLLRWGGLLSVLDLEKGSEVALATEVEAFWLSDAITCQAGSSGPLGGPGAWGAGTWPPAPAPGSDPGSAGSSLGASGAEAAAGLPTAPAAAGAADASSGGTAAASAAAASSTLDVEMPWWLYGPAGMQLCFPSSLAVPQSPHAYMAPYKEGHDIELEFDQEVYPVGISLADDAIVGITQRIVRGPWALLAAGGGGGGGAMAAPASQLPCFHPIPESQPVLPCLLRRLLQRGAFKEAVMLARRHARGPHFARSLEWLLFTSLEIETNTSSLTRPPGNARRPGSVMGSTPRGGGGGGDSDASGGEPRLQSSASKQAPPPQSLLSAAAELVRHFPALFAEVVVSVARKTDAALWPPLFDAVGSPSLLLEGLVEAGELASAACFLLIIDRLEGAPAAQGQALRLMRSSLSRGQYPLCCELLRFVVPPSPSEVEGRVSTTELSFSVGIDGLAPAADEEPEPQPGTRQPSATSGAGPAAQESAPAEAAGGEQGEQGGGRSWLGWLLGYGSGTSNATKEGPPSTPDEQQQQQPRADAEPPLSSATDPEGAPPPPTLPAVSRVQQTLALLGDTGPSGSGRLPLPLPGSPAAPAGPVTPSSPALAQMLLAAGAAPTSSAATAESACKLVAEHAWSLLESGHLVALGQLAQASAFLPSGLAGLMDAHRDGAYAASGCAAHAPLELLSALALAVSELPVWSSEEVEAVAGAVAALCREVGAVAWAIALAVLLVDAATVSAFRQAQPALWAQFVSMLHADASFSYLWDIVDVLGEEAGEEQEEGEGSVAVMGAGSIGGAAGEEAGAERDGRESLILGGLGALEGGEAGEGPLAAALRAAGGLTASAGHVEVRPLAYRDVHPHTRASFGSMGAAGSEIEADMGPASGSSEVGGLGQRGLR